MLDNVKKIWLRNLYLTMIYIIIYHLEGLYEKKVYLFTWIYNVCVIKHKNKLATWATIGQCLLGELFCPWVSHFVYAGAFQLYKNYVST